MTKRILKYSITALTTIFFLFAIFVIISGTIAKKQNKMINIFGYSYSVVATNSMEPTIDVGEIIISKKKNYSDVKVGDIVVFYSKDYKVYFVHRVIEIDKNNELVTKGDNPLANVDEDTVNESNYSGVVIKYGNLLNIGNLVLKNRGLIFLAIIVILFYIIISEIVVIAKSLKEDKENELKLQKDKLLEEEKLKLKNEVLEEIKEEKNI